MRKIPILKRFKFRTWVVSVIFFLTAFIILSDVNRGYVTEANFLFIAKSEKSAPQARDIAFNISNFPSKLSFYDLLIKQEQGPKDVFLGLDPTEKKKAWSEQIETELIGDKQGTIIKVKADAKNRSDANLYSKEIPNTLFDMTSKYYDIKEDVGLVLLERPVVYTQIKNFPTILALSLVFALGLAYLFEVFIFSPKKLVNRKSFPELEKIKNLKNILKPAPKVKTTPKQEPKRGEVAIPEDVNYDISQYQSERRAEEVEDYVDKEKENVESIEEEPLKEEEEKNESLKEFREVYDKIREASYPNYPEMPKRSEAGKSGGAPSNLPVGDADIIFGQGSPKSESTEEPKRRREDKLEDEIKETQVSSREEKEEKKSEPTEEEIKERLNKLLRGEM